MSGKAFLTKSRRGIIDEAFLDEKITWYKTNCFRLDYFRLDYFRSGIVIYIRTKKSDLEFFPIKNWPMVVEHPSKTEISLVNDHRIDPTQNYVP